MKSKFRKELNAGTISLIILAIMARAKEPMYGYLIAKSLEGLNPEEDPKVKKGSIYPVLRSLEKNQLLSSEVEPSVSGPPRKYYSITESGAGELDEWKEIWANTRDLVDGILTDRISIESD